MIIRTLQILTGATLLVRAAQPSAPLPVAAPMRDLPWGDINFLQTTDTHGWHAGHLQESQYSGDWGDYISFAARMREKADNLGVDLLLVDTGDRIEGNGLYDASSPKGEFTSNIIKEQDIDIICIGNHELYQAASADREYTTTVPNFKGNYIASNLDVIDKNTGDFIPLAQRYRKFTTKNQGVRVVAFGFLFDFAGNANNTRVQTVEETIKEKWFQDAIREKTDLFAIAGHVPARSPEYKALYKAIRSQNWDTPIHFFSGHFHIRDYKKYDSKAYAIAAGRYMETIGFASIEGIIGKGKKEPKEVANLASMKFARRYIDNNLLGYYHHTGLNETTFPTEHGHNVSQYIRKAREELDLDHAFGCAPQDLWLNRAPYPSNSSILTWLEEQVLPGIVQGENRTNVPRIAITNSGAMRFDIFKGAFTIDTTFIVSPFPSGFNYIKDVPWSVAQRIVPLINRGGPVFGMTDAQISMLSSPEQMGIERLMMSADATPESSGSEAQHPLSTSSRKPDLTPGYTTKDDAGDDGDDTIHSPIEFFKVPNVIQSAIDFPEDGKPETVDIVFLEFIQPWIIFALKFIEGDFDDSDVLPYIKGQSFTNMVAKWVHENWNGKC